jgi:hypothetical protein
MIKIDSLLHEIWHPIHSLLSILRLTRTHLSIRLVHQPPHARVVRHRRQDHSPTRGNFTIFSLNNRKRQAKPKKVRPLRQLPRMSFSSRWFATLPKLAPNDIMLMMSAANSATLSERQTVRCAAACSRILVMNRLTCASKRDSHVFLNWPMDHGAFDRALRRARCSSPSRVVTKCGGPRLSTESACVCSRIARLLTRQSHRIPISG